MWRGLNCQQKMILNNKDYKQYKKIIKTRKIIRFSTIFLSLIVLSFAIVFVYNFDLTIENTANDHITENLGPECSNLSFQDTAVCLNDYVREIFIYNVTDDSIDLSLSDLQKRGGDCKSYSDFYKKYMEFYGYDQDNQIVKGLVEKNETVTFYHVFLTSFDSTGYCHFDMKDLECYRYVNDRGEVKD